MDGTPDSEKRMNIIARIIRVISLNNETFDHFPNQTPLNSGRRSDCIMTIGHNKKVSIMMTKMVVTKGELRPRISPVGAHIV